MNGVIERGMSPYIYQYQFAPQPWRAVTPMGRIKADARAHNPVNVKDLTVFSLSIFHDNMFAGGTNGLGLKQFRVQVDKLKGMIGSCQPWR